MRDFKFLVVRIYLPTAFLLISFLPAWSQEAKETEPDGTEGERHEVDSDTLKHSWRDRRWRLFPGKFSSLKLGAGFLYEYAGYSADASSKRQMDSIGSPLEQSFSVRDMRLLASGRLKKVKGVSWKVGVMYDGQSGEWFLRESGIMIAVPKLWGQFFIGRTKEGFSLNKVMNGYSGWTMERQMAIDVIPILADGVKWLGYMPKSRILWNIGGYGDWVSEGQSFSTYRWQVAARIGWLPIFTTPEKTVLHLGVNYRYGEPKNGSIRVRSKPEVNAAPRFIDTNNFSSDHSDHIGGEAYYRSGPWMVGSEFYVHRFKSALSANPIFTGGEVVVSYLFNGASRPYYTSTAIFGFVPVTRPVSKGGPGVWEAVVRYSTLDLNGGTVQGGKMWRVTPMINWYLSSWVRLEFVYGYGVLDRFALKGATHFFQTRVQITIL